MRDPGEVDEAVLAVVAAIPAGRIASYADVASIVAELGPACTPRRAARALRDFGADVPWWRVVRSDGCLAQPVAHAAAAHLAGDGVFATDNHVPLQRLRWDPDLDELVQLLPGSQM